MEGDGPVSKRLKARKLAAGDWVTTTEAVEGYYSNYAGRPVFNFEPGMEAVVVHPASPAVRGPLLHVVIEFRSPITGRVERAALTRDQTVRLKRTPDKVFWFGAGVFHPDYLTTWKKGAGK